MFKERLLIGQYFAADSPIHRLNARVKILAALIYMIALFIVDDWWGWGFLTTLAILVTGVSRIPLKALWRGLKIIVIFCLITVALNLFIYPGEEIFRWGVLSISREGLVYGLAMGLRLLLLVLFASLLTLTTTPIALTDALEQLLAPLRRIRVPAHEIAMMMSIALRFIPTILEEFERIVLAQRARGAVVSRGSILKRAKAFIPMLIPLFISAFRRAEELAAAMEARCYRGGEGRSKWRVTPWRIRDTLVLIAFLLLFAGAIFYRTI